MQSRQIQVFGVIGSSVLVLFIVIFLGADIQRLLQNFTQGTISLTPISDDQVVMEASAVKDLTDRINSESRELLQSMQAHKVQTEYKEYKVQTEQPEKKTPQTLTEQERESVPVDVTQQPSQITGMSDDVQAKALSDIEVQKRVVPDIEVNTETTESVNSEIRTLLRSVPFFRHSEGLTPENERVLDAIAEKLTSIDYPYTLVVEGHTESGSVPDMSEKMAFDVASYLKRKLSAVVIDSVGYADAYPIIDDPANIENRRVEIIVRRSEG
ncbi:MAG: hypothetical protein DSZ05_00160 [Sulfurospirillum sp.]|nr:MAG: hypothetical protein DSZ05_00160 [Sulfurospirillum sp.]